VGAHGLAPGGGGDGPGAGVGVSWRRIEEAPAAYKPIGPVVASQVEAGIVREVARMAPLMTFKA